VFLIDDDERKSRTGANTASARRHHPRLPGRQRRPAVESLAFAEMAVQTTACAGRLESPAQPRHRLGVSATSGTR